MEGEEFGQKIIEEFHPMKTEINKEINPLLKMKETLPQLEQNYITIQKIQYVPLKFNIEEIRKLQEADPQYAKLIENMKPKNKMSKQDYSLDLHGALYKKIKDHGKEFILMIVPKTIQKYYFMKELIV